MHETDRRDRNPAAELPADLNDEALPGTDSNTDDGSPEGETDLPGRGARIVGAARGLFASRSRVAIGSGLSVGVLGMTLAWNHFFGGTTTPKGPPGKEARSATARPATKPRTAGTGSEPVKPVAPPTLTIGGNEPPSGPTEPARDEVVAPTPVAASSDPAPATEAAAPEPEAPPPVALASNTNPAPGAMAEPVIPPLPASTELAPPTPTDSAPAEVVPPPPVLTGDPPATAVAETVPSEPPPATPTEPTPPPAESTAPVDPAEPPALGSLNAPPGAADPEPAPNLVDTSVPPAESETAVSPPSTIPNLAATPAEPPAEAAPPPPEPTSPQSDLAMGATAPSGDTIELPNAGSRLPSLDQPLGEAQTMETTPVSLASASPAADSRAQLAVSDTIEPVVHVVQRGENFWTISRLYYGSGRFYKALWKVNAATCPTPDALQVGSRIKVPPPEALDRGLIESGNSPPPRQAEATPAAAEARTVEPASDTVVMLPRGQTLPGSETLEPPPANAAGRVYVVQRPQETLRSVARDQLGDPRREDDLRNMNLDVLGDRDRLIPGMRLRLPADAVDRSRP